MKKLLSLIIVISFSEASRAQNIFPSSGKVGIGTDNPNVLLQVNSGAIRLTNPSSYPYGMNIDLSIAGGWVREYSFSYNGAGKLFSLGVWGNDSTLNYGYIGGNSTANNAYGNPWMVFLPNGNVGIGTTNPTGKLTVAGVNNYNNIQFTGNSTTGVGISLQNTQSGGHKFDLFSGGSNNKAGVGNFALYDETAGAYRFIINHSGNVLIGETSQTNSSYKLDVNGNIRANQVTVNATGADYVFDPDYPIRSIDSLNNYIVACHHLPGMPSAGQMQQKGDNLGATQMKMLQNEEEMTLYIINMNKKIKELENQIKQLNAQVKELKSRHP